MLVMPHMLRRWCAVWKRTVVIASRATVEKRMIFSWEDGKHFSKWFHMKSQTVECLDPHPYLVRTAIWIVQVETKRHFWDYVITSGSSGQGKWAEMWVCLKIRTTWNLFISFWNFETDTLGWRLPYFWKYPSSTSDSESLCRCLSFRNASACCKAALFLALRRKSFQLQTFFMNKSLQSLDFSQAGILQTCHRQGREIPRFPAAERQYVTSSPVAERTGPEVEMAEASLWVFYWFACESATGHICHAQILLWCKIDNVAWLHDVKL